MIYYTFHLVLIFLEVTVVGKLNYFYRQMKQHECRRISDSLFININWTCKWDPVIMISNKIE